MEGRRWEGRTASIDDGRALERSGRREGGRRPTLLNRDGVEDASGEIECSISE